MKRKNMARNALFTSIISLLLCVSMLVGTTFAWFTDTVTSGSNVIASGNLDIEVQYTLDGSKWENLNGAKDLFQKSLWEPGHTEVVALKIENKGSLALKYVANMNIVEEIVGKSVLGNDIVLSDILTVSTKYAEEAEVAQAFASENGVTYGSPVAFKSASVLKSDAQMEPNDTQYVIIKVDMAETVGNEANHDGVNKPSINFGINILATQYTYEEDSFGPNYDKNATYPVVSTPVVMPEQGEPAVEVTLTTAEETPVSIEVPSEIVEALPDTVTSLALAHTEPEIDKDAKTVTFQAIDIVDQNGVPVELSELNLPNKLTIKLPVGDAFNEGDSVTVYHDGEFICNADVHEGYITYEVAHLCEVILEGYAPINPDADTIKIDTLGQLLDFAEMVNGGVTSFAGKTVVLTADIDLNNTAWTPVGNWDYAFEGTFDGQGFAIKNLNISDATPANDYAAVGFFGITDKAVVKNLVIENVTIKSNGQMVAAAIGYPSYTDVENITVRGDIAIEGGNYTAGVLGYTRLCQNASNLVVSGNTGSYITGATTVGGITPDIQMNHELIANYSNFSVSNVTITGDKCVGGISGIICNQALAGATVKNVVLNASDDHVGIVAGALDSVCNLSKVDTENVTGATVLVGANYSSTGTGELYLDGKLVACNGDNLKAALAAGKDVTLANDITMTATGSNGYGKAGITVNGQILDGNGHTLKVTNAGATWDSAIYIKSGTVKDITVAGAMRGVFTSDAANGDIYLEDVIFSDVIYTFNSDGTSNNREGGVYLTNCAMNGWTSYSDTHTEVVFNNCSFAKGSGYSYYRPYNATTLNGCTFSQDMTVDNRAEVTFKNCTYKGEAVTNEVLANWVSNPGKATVE